MDWIRRPRPLAAAVTAACALTLACGERPSATRQGAPPPPAVASVDTLATPAGPDSGEPNLAATPDGLFLSWLERTGPDTHALRFSRWNDGWSEPGTVMERSGLFVNWADFPAFTALDDGTLAAHWLEKSGPGTYAYDIRMAISRDGGVSWSDDIVPHRDGVEAEHGFVSLLPFDDAVAVVWLDGRETVNGDPMTLRFTALDPDGGLGPETVLDSSTCDCCQTAMARTDEGLIVAYRDRSPDEVRDIYVTRRVDGQWTPGAPVHDDGWVIPGCPVNGPAMGADGARVAIAWFTGAPLDPDAGREDVRAAGEQGRVLAAFSDDGGATFGEPVRVDDGEAMGRVALAVLDDGSALVAWLERVDGSAEIRLRHVDETGVGPARAITGTSARRASGFPRMVRVDDRVFFAWTEPGEVPRVRTAVARISAPEGPTPDVETRAAAVTGSAPTLAGEAR